MPGIRYGSVPFLNARPLTEGLAGLVCEVPSRLAGRLSSGELDVALVSSIEAIRRPGCAIVPGISISSPGPVGSVLLFARKPLAECRRVLLTEASLTSTALTRLLLAEVGGGERVFRSCPLDTDPRRMDGDAVLLIGDAALNAPRDGLEVHDLATLWRERHGLPFCFAVWLARDGEVAAAAEEPLRAAKARGLALRPTYAREAAAASGLGEDLLFEYLTERITYDLGDAERAALTLFWKLVSERGLL